MAGTKAQVETLTVTGAFSTMGHAHGEACRREIRALLADRTEILLRESRDLRPTRLEAICRTIWGYLAARYSNLTEELTATAEAADIAPWQLIVAGAYTDLLNVCQGTGSAYGECTLGLSVSPRFIAGTWDSHPSAEEALLLLHRRPDVGPATLALTTAGWPAQQGVNSDGLAFAIANLTPRHVRVEGLPYIAANALLAASRSPDEFVRLAERENFCSGHSYIFIGLEGPARVVQTTGAGVDVETVTSFATIANHYRSASPLDDNRAYVNYEGSCKRETELHSVLARLSGPAAFAHVVAGTTLVNRTDVRGAVVTCAYFYLDPVRREVWYQRGPVEDEEMNVARLP